MARKLINVHQFNNGPPRLLLASLASGLLSVDAFIDSRLQKHLNREVKLSDAVAKGQEVRWNSHNRRYNLVGAAAEKDDPEEQEEVAGESSALPIKPTKYNPVMVCIYGQLCIAAKSYQSGICKFLIDMHWINLTIAAVYLLHAYEYQPNDPVICLSLAIAYMGRAMQRQTDNRHFMIAEVSFCSITQSIINQNNKPFRVLLLCLVIEIYGQGTKTIMTISMKLNIILGGPFIKLVGVALFNLNDNILSILVRSFPLRQETLRASSQQH